MKTAVRKFLRNFVVLCYLLMVFIVPSAFSESIDLRITMNGRYGSVALLPEEPLTLKLQVVPYGTLTTDGDLWFLSTDNSRLYWYDGVNGWQASYTPTPMLSGTVSSEPWILIDSQILPRGLYNFYTGWDSTANRAIDWQLLRVSYGSVQVTTDALLLALDHLAIIMDQFHNSFYVYKDLDSPANHFVLPAQMGGGKVEMDLRWKDNCAEGESCIRCSFDGRNWGGYMFLNGVLKGDDVAPRANWGEDPDAGIDLSGAARLCMAVRGENGGERVEFFAFSIHDKPFGDSAEKVSSGFLTLSKEWQRICVPIHDRNLSYIINGFGWVTSDAQTEEQPIVFYIDDVYYEKPSLDTLRFLKSYEGTRIHPALKNGGFTYDNALALLAFLCTPMPESLQRAKLLADALVYTVEHDRFFNDGRIRNAYNAGDLILPNGWEPHGKKGTVRIPGWTKENGEWEEDSYSVSTHTGNVAWAMLALLGYYELSAELPEKKAIYLETAKHMGEWIEANCRDERGAGGYTGGYEGWEPTNINPTGQKRLMWKSTEHNLDVFAAFMRLYYLTGDSTWLERAQHAKKFIDSMWNKAEARYYAGTLEDGITINDSVKPIDVNTWGYLAMAGVDDPATMNRALDWVLNHSIVEQDGYRGIDFNDDRDGIWWEGTAQLALAMKLAGRTSEAASYIQQMERWQVEAPNGNGRGIVAATKDNLSTGLEWTYDRKLHVGATAWFIMALRAFNPFWPINYNR